MSEIENGIVMEEWKIVFHSILEIFDSIVASSIFHTEISIPFYSIFNSIPDHASLLAQCRVW